MFWYKGWGLRSFFGTAEEQAEAVLGLRAVVAIYASVLLWVGAWDLLTERRHARHNASTDADDDEILTLMPPNETRELLYFFLGLLGLLATNTLYANGGYSGGYFPPEWTGRWSILIPQIMVAQVAQIFFWTGGYNILDGYHTIGYGEGIQHDVLLTGVGCFLIFATNGLPFVSYVYPAYDESIMGSDPEYGSPWREHFLHGTRALLTIAGSQCLWVAQYNLLDNYTDTTLWRDLGYCGMGMFLMTATRSVVANSWLKFGDDPEQPQSVWYWCRCVVALMGQFLNNTGAWNIFDLYLFENTYLRNAAYIGVAYILLLLSGAAVVNSAVPIPEEDDDEGAIECQTDSESPTALAVKKLSINASQEKEPLLPYVNKSN